MSGLKCVVVGGAGALGSQLTSKLLAIGSQVINIDIYGNSSATANVSLSLPISPETIKKASLEAKNFAPFDAIFCVAGGWQGGDVKNEDFIDGVFEMWNKNITSSLVAASLAPEIKKDGLLVFTSAKASLSPSPSMIAYGMSKCAINNMVSSLSSPKAGLPICVIAILPETLDTTANRGAMPNGNFSSWTKLEVVSEKLAEWLAAPKQRPSNGSLVTVVTRNDETKFEVAS